jgi:hypothetical protein
MHSANLSRERAPSGEAFKMNHSIVSRIFKLEAVTATANISVAYRTRD